MITQQRPYIYPVTDSSLSQASYEEFADGPWLTRAAMEWFWNAYAPGREDRRRVRGVDQAMAASRVSLTLARVSVSARLACRCGSPNLTI